MSISVLQSTDGYYFFRIVASNGRILAHSETYYNRSDAVSAANLIKTQAWNATVS